MEFKLGVVPPPTVVGMPGAEQQAPKLGVVQQEAPSVLTPPGLGIVPSTALPLTGPEPKDAISEHDQSRFHLIKKIQENLSGDDPAFRELVNEAYRMVFLQPPVIYRFESPLAAMLAVKHLGHLHGTDVEYHSTPLAAFQAPLKTRLGVAEAIGVANIINDLTEALEGPIETQINAAFVDRFTDRLTGMIGPLRPNTRLFDRIPRNVLEWWGTVKHSECWWWPYRTFLVISDHPRMSYDEDRRLHRTDGHAVEFGDGTGLYYYQGWKVPEQVILHPETLTIDQIDRERNSETRRIMIERMGPGNYLRKSGAIVVDLDTLTLEGSAPRALMEDRRGEKWLVGTDGSTARVYTMPVPRQAKSCREAHEWISGFPENRLIAEA